MSTQVLSEMNKRTLIMGILNSTPDSFSDGGRFLAVDAALAHASTLIEEGADILDVGGESSRPGADPVPLEEERRRVIPVIERVRREFPNICISIDTYKSGVARAALDVGADIINDISAMRFDTSMAQATAAAGCPIVLMHMQGTPKTMMQDPQYAEVVGEVIGFLRERIEYAKACGISEDKLIVDPGFGFGKKPEHNTAILKRLHEFKILGKPVLIGTSRKSFLGAITRRPVEERMEESIASAVIGVLNGASIVRAHDVKSLKHAVRVAEALR